MTIGSVWCELAQNMTMIWTFRFNTNFQLNSYQIIHILCIFLNKPQLPRFLHMVSINHGLQAIIYKFTHHVKPKENKYNMLLLHPALISKLTVSALFFSYLFESMQLIHKRLLHNCWMLRCCVFLFVILYPFYLFLL